MTVKIGICDDMTQDIRILSEALHSYDPFLEIFTYTDGESMIEDCLDSKILFDIIFLDIYMPGINGLEIASKIRALRNDVKIIFISSSNEHYPEAYDVFAFNYILKPLNLEKLQKILEQALVDTSMERRRQLSFNYKGTTHRIFSRDILYIESRDKIVFFHMTDKKTFKCYGKLDDIFKQLPDEHFIRCHQSFIVNILYVSEMSDNHFRTGASVINISKKYQKSAKDKYFTYLFENMNKGF